MKILPNGIAVLEGDSHVSKWVQESNRLDHDQNMLPVILPYIKEGDTVVDGGAFIGDHTIAYLNAVGLHGVVWAFEPSREAFLCLKHNCPRAFHFNCGLSDRPGYITLTRGDNKGATFGIEAEEGESVVPLDMYEMPDLDFLKLDIEGMELRAIRGAKETILRCKPTILVEVNEFALNRNQTTGKELISEIENLGYFKKKVYESDTLDTPMFDLLFIPQ